MTSYAVDTETHEGSQTGPTISGESTFAALGSKNYNRTNAAYAKGYTTYTFHGTTHNWYDGSDHGTTAPAAVTGFTYTWELTNMAGYATVNSSTGQVAYSTLVPEASRVGVLKCTAVPNGYSDVQLVSEEFPITFVNPDGLENPVINSQAIDASTIEVWFSYPGNLSGVTLHYTTNGSNPTTSSATIAPGTHFTVSNGTVVKVIAAKGGSSTQVVEQSFNLVVLDDREDHNWTYYSDAESPIKSLYPRNVQITYYGNGTNTVSTSNGANPAANTFTASTNNAVAVSMYESENTFVYYKTLERYVPINNLVEGTPQNIYPYDLIPNPFSKRPTYGTNADNKWRGFYGWRVKSISGGKIYSNANQTGEITTGTILTTEYQKLYFLPNDAGETNANNATSMTIEFEAVWARAYRVTTSVANVNTNLASSTFQNGVSYERNFLVINSGNTSTTNLSQTNQRPVTVMMVEPDGSNDYRTSGRYINPTYVIAQNNLKFEWMNMQVSNTLSANAKNLVVGRGVKAASGANNDNLGNMATTDTNPDLTNTANVVNGLGATTNNNNTNYTSNVDYYLRIESGVYSNIYYASSSANYSRGVVSGSATLHVTGFLGNDYDRAKNDNNRLAVKTAVLEGTGANNATSGGFSNTNYANALLETMALTVKSGTTGTSFNNAIYNSTYEPGPTNAFYTAVGSNARACGLRRTDFEGGSIHCLTGGMEVWNGTHTDEAYNKDKLVTDIRIRYNALIRSAAFGGPANSAHYGIRRMVFTGGQVNGWVAGACNGNSDSGGQLYGVTQVYVGGNVKVGDATHEITVNDSQGGNVFGAGRGRASSVTTGEVAYGTNLVVADNANILHNVYGGGDLGYALKLANVHILGGTVGGSVFGGSNQKRGENVNIVMKNGLVKGGVYGGSNSSGIISGSVTMQIIGGQVGTSGQNANIHGGGYGASTQITGNVDITLGDSNGNKPTVYGDVYGGSALGSVNNSTSNHTNVTMNDGLIHGDIYGGGLGNSSTEANVNGNVSVTINKGTAENVFGCNNINGKPSGTVAVTMTDGTINHSVYGGGNAAAYTGNPTVTISGGEVKENVFGAGLGNTATVTGSTSVTITNAATKIGGSVYGGGSNGSVSANAAVSITDAKVGGSVYGAGKGAESDVAGEGGTSVTIKKSASVKGSVYGGAEEGTVRGAVSQSSANYGHNVTNVTIENGLVAGNVYGGGKMGIVNGRTIVNMLAGTVEGNLFGGALGEQGSVYVRGLKTINMKGGLVVGDIYGGSQNADDSNEYYGTADADNHNSIFVNISGGQVGENVYGGGFFGKIKGSVTVNIGVDAIKNGTDHDANINKLELADADKVMTKLEGSIYAGSDWGTVSESGTFGPNNITGYSNIYIDGGGYDMNATLQNNYMNISGSIYGSGTSSDAGSKGRRIFIRNYGLDHAVNDATINELTYSTCSRKLYTIQRADSVFLENSHITFRGQGDMASPSTTQHYSMYNIFRVLRLVNNSTIDCEYPVANLYSLNSMALLGENKTIFNARIGKEDATTKTGDYTVVMYDRYAQTPDVWKDNYCSPNFNYADACQLANRVYQDTETPAAIDNKIRINNGVYFAVRYPRAWNKGLTVNQYQYGNEIDAQTLYGEFRGFFHVIYPQNCGFLYSRPRVTTEELPSDLIYNNNRDFTKYWQKENIYDGGTSSYRVARAFDAHGGNVALAGYPDPSDAKKLQGPYINHLPNTASGTAPGPTPTAGSTVVCDRNYYRVWEIKGAGGNSQVEAVLVAKTDGTNSDEFFTTTTTIPLSPINQGGYVVIRHGGPTAPWGNWGDDVNIVNAGVISQYAGSPEENYAYFVEGLDNHGWHGPVANTNPNVISELEKIKALPNTTFGLSIKPMERLSETQTYNGGWTQTGDMLVSIGSVSDDNYLNNTRLYAGGEGATMLQFCLTYSNLLDRNTVLSPITIFFDEYSAEGTKLYTTEVQVTITTQTTIDQDFNEPLYALEFGKGEVHDKFSVKATLPIFAMGSEGTESEFKVTEIGAPVFNTELTGGTPQLVSVSAFNAMPASEIGENVIAIKFGPSLTYDNTNGWLGNSFSYDDPEASLVDITTLSSLPYTLGTADGRKNLGMQFDLYYNGSLHYQGDNDIEICHFPVTLSVSNLAGSAGDADLKITVYVYKRGKGTDWYIDGVKGRNSNTGHNPDKAKLTLNGVLADEYKPGDNIFIVNQVTVNSVNTTVWPDEKGGSEGVTLYRYPGGHLLSDGVTIDPDGCYDGPLVVAKSDLQLYGIILNGLDSICNNGKTNYIINNVLYEKGENFNFTVNSPLVVVENDGAVTMNRSEFIYNNNQSSTNLGGAILVENGGTLNINGQSFITNNKTTSSDGAGVYVASGATVNVMEDVYVAGNTKGSASARSNVYLPDVASVINIDKENGLSSGSFIGVTKNEFPTEESFTPIAFSSVQHKSEDAFNQGFFFDDQGIYIVYYDAFDDDLSANNIYFGKTWVTVVTSAPDDWDITAIDDPEDLAWLISCVNGYNGCTPLGTDAVATVTANIDMNEYIWVPIGDATNSFEGVFDGGGYEITGLHSSMTGVSSQGLFGYVDNGTVKNTFVLGGTLTAKDKERVYMGSIAGVVKNDGKVYASEGALNLNTVAETTIMGGLVGLLDNSTLHSSISVANLNGYQMGGLVGETTDGAKVLNSYSYTQMTDAQAKDESDNVIPNDKPVAGFVADNASTSSTAAYIDNCYLRLRKGNSLAHATLYAFDAASKASNVIQNAYYFSGDDFTGHLSNGATDPDNSWRTFNVATHPYTYAENYNRLNDKTNPSPEDPYMLDVLNQNAVSLTTTSDVMLPWTRTTSDINNDYPVLKMPAGMAVSTNLTDSILYYHHTLNDALTRYSGKNAIVAAYASSETPVNVEQTENVELYINEDVALLQEVDLDAYVGITLDNSAGSNGANPTNGDPDEIDWHMFSSALQNAPLGINYNGDLTQMDWWNEEEQGDYPFYADGNANAGYFPGNTPTSARPEDGGFDFYCYYEPQYHWINFKRNGNSHWHQDGDDHAWIDYQYTPNGGSLVHGSAANNESQLIHGKGYLLSVNDETFLQANGTLNNGTVTYPDVTYTETAHCPGLNLLGNPYQSYLDFDEFAEENHISSYSILDEDKRGYVPYAAESSTNSLTASRYIHMHQGFFVVTDASKTVTFNNDMRSATATDASFRGNERPAYPLVNLILTEASGNKDYAIVELGRPDVGGAKKVESLRSGKAQVYIHYDNEDYSLAFTESGISSVPVRFRTDADGVFTLNWNTQNGSFSYLHLIDNLNGMDIDCLENDEYVFSATADDYESRFKLVFAYTGVEENEIELPDNFAFFNGDELIVNGEGRLECVDLQGRRLFVTDVYGAQNHVTLPDCASGLYLLHLSNGKQAKVQKIVIK